MKGIAWVLVLGCGGWDLAYGQTPRPAPKSVPDLGQLFQLPATPENSKPQFKLQVPGDDLQAFMVPESPLIVTPRQQAPGDPGIVHRPKGFAQRQPRPAQPHNIYPDLKVLPIEMAKLDAPGNLASQPRLEAIPRVWPKAKVEPIPTTWEGYRVVPVAGSADAMVPKK